MFIKTLSNHHFKRFNVDILENNNHVIYIISWKFELKSQFSGNTTKTNFNWTKYVLGNECKYNIIKALARFPQTNLYITFKPPKTLLMCNKKH